MEFYNKYQFALWRILFGIFLLISFVRMLPYSTEIFSSEGVLSDSRANWTYGLFPNPLYIWDSPGFIILFILLLIGLSIFFIFGFYRRISSLLLWFGWASLYHRNNLTIDPTLAYIGWLLLACAIIPGGEPLSIFTKKNYKWNMPFLIYFGAWVVLGVSYFYSGFIKFFFPSWIDGTAMIHIYNSVISGDSVILSIMLILPIFILKLQTWIVMGLQLTSPLLFLFNKLRFVSWSLLTLLHIMVLLTLNLVDVSIGILIFHLFVFDYRWSKKWIFKKIFSHLPK